MTGMETKRPRVKCIATALVCQLCWTLLWLLLANFSHTGLLLGITVFIFTELAYLYGTAVHNRLKPEALLVSKHTEKSKTAAAKCLCVLCFALDLYIINTVAKKQMILEKLRQWRFYEGGSGICDDKQQEQSHRKAQMKVISHATMWNWKLPSSMLLTWMACFSSSMCCLSAVMYNIGVTGSVSFTGNFRTARLHKQKQRRRNLSACKIQHASLIPKINRITMYTHV